MSDPSMPGLFRAWLGTHAGASAYAGVGASFGGILMVLALALGKESVWTWFFAGALIPPGILAFAFTTDWMFEKRLRSLKHMHDEKLITKPLYEEQLERAMAWRADRLYGNGGDGSSRRIASSSKKPTLTPGSRPMDTDPGN